MFSRSHSPLWPWGNVPSDASFLPCGLAGLRGARFVLAQVTEEALLAWADEKKAADADERRYVESPDVRRFLEWLRESEDDSDEDEEDEDEEDNSCAACSS